MIRKILEAIDEAKKLHPTPALGPLTYDRIAELLDGFNWELGEEGFWTGGSEYGDPDEDEGVFWERWYHDPPLTGYVELQWEDDTPGPITVRFRLSSGKNTPWVYDGVTEPQLREMLDALEE